MKPVTVRTTVDLAGPRELVWELLTDWERQADWMLEMSDVVVTSRHREGVGVEALATVRIGGISTRDVIRVDVWEPPHRLGLAHEGWVRGRGDMELTPTPDGNTHLDWTESLVPPRGAVGTLGLSLFRPLLARTFKRDVRVLSELVRSRAYPGNST
ncbi:MAG: SRPBCC family protein [Actinomycetota bacterium]